MSTTDLVIIGASTGIGLLLIGAACVVFRIEGQPRNRPAAARRVSQASTAPLVWLAVKGGNLSAIQTAFGMQNPKPCSWRLANEHWLFVTEPAKGWMLVAGHALAEPSQDVDECYRLVRKLSRELGQVQLFHANPVVGHHGWIKAQRGRILRAYVWAGNTVWNQGPITDDEKALGLQCPDYAADLSYLPQVTADAFHPNCKKVPQLAARWSIDWSELNQFLCENPYGIAGDPPRNHLS